MSAPGNDQTIYYHTHRSPSLANRLRAIRLTTTAHRPRTGRARTVRRSHTGPGCGDAAGSFRIPIPSPGDSALARTSAIGDADGGSG